MGCLGSLQGRGILVLGTVPPGAPSAGGALEQQFGKFRHVTRAHDPLKGPPQDGRGGDARRRSGPNCPCGLQKKSRSFSPLSRPVKHPELLAAGLSSNEEEWHANSLGGGCFRITYPAHRHPLDGRLLTPSPAAARSAGRAHLAAPDIPRSREIYRHGEFAMVPTLIGLSFWNQLSESTRHPRRS
jgi:hypothetical protein